MKQARHLRGPASAARVPVSSRLCRVAAAAVFAIAAATHPVAASHLATIAVVDLQYLDRFFYRHSGPTRELRLQEARLYETIGNLRRRTDELQASRLRLIQAGDVDGAQIAAQELAEWTSHARRRIRGGEVDISRARSELADSDPYYRALTRAIDYVAESRGYTFVFDIRSSAFAFASNSIDITEDIRYLVSEWM